LCATLERFPILDYLFKIRFLFERCKYSCHMSVGNRNSKALCGNSWRGCIYNLTIFTTYGDTSSTYYRFSLTADFIAHYATVR